MQYYEDVRQAEDIYNKICQLNSPTDFEEQSELEKLKSDFKNKYRLINHNIIRKIQDKTIELEICSWEGDLTTVWDWNRIDINDLKEKVTQEDLPEIQLRGHRYVEFRKTTNTDYFKKYFFKDLDKTLLVLFIYYDKNFISYEFKNFGSKIIYVGKELSEQRNSNNSLKEETELSKKIRKHFGFFNRNCPRKHRQILKDEDFDKLICWTIVYFENNFKVPEISEPIKVVNTNKTFVQLAFKYLFKELHKASTYPDSLFEFYRNAFSPYSDDKRSNFVAVKNNDDVKKLMLLDY